MALNDVWRNINQELGIFWKDRFDEVPPIPGFYAWFYPLRLPSLSLHDLIQDINHVLLFDANCNGVPKYNAETGGAWQKFDILLAQSVKSYHPNQSIEDAWAKAIDDPQALQLLQRALMKASLFLPPLYVGKATNLRDRCSQHLRGKTSSNFHQRFEAHAEEMKTRTRRVPDLLFACIHTQMEESRASSDSVSLAEVLESALLALAKPPYSQR